MNGWNQIDTLYVSIGLLTLTIIVCFICIVRLSKKMKRMNQLFQRLGAEETNENITEHLEEMLKQAKQMEEDYQVFKKRLKTQKGNVGIIRFNAFLNEGSDLSFSIAIIDDEESGFVLTSIYGRDESRMYAKPLDKGISLYNLTNEEKEAILEAKRVLS